ncbi:MAG TPA: hypothetical protein VMB75_01885 [Rhodocyclaceae bacterium]|nr:hypothetical protein [Rhodocyclaceae bacterium]
MKRSILFLLSLALCAGAAAKLPPPPPEAAAKAELAKAENAHKDKVAAYKNCLVQNAVAKRYLAAARGKTTTESPACVDPGPFVPPPMAAAAPAAPVPVAPAAAAKK